MLVSLLLWATALCDGAVVIGVRSGLRKKAIGLVKLASIFLWHTYMICFEDDLRIKANAMGALESGICLRVLRQTRELGC